MAIAATDCAYAAGILDGEGTIGVSIRGSSLCVMVEVWNTDSRLAKWLQERFGGMPPYVRLNNSFCAKPLHRWALFGSASLSFLQSIQPYLVLKQQQCALCLELLTELSPGKGKRLTDNQRQRISEIHTAMRMLNKRGGND